MADEEKRIHELVETSDKTGKYIALDAPGLAESLKYSADLLIDKAQTDPLYVKLVGDETVNGVKTWVNQGVFQAGISVTAGNISNLGSYSSTLDGAIIQIQKTDLTQVVGLGHNTGNDYGYIEIKDGTGAAKCVIRGGAASNVQAYFTGGWIGIGIAIPLSTTHIYENTPSVGASTGLTIEQDGTGDAEIQFLISGAQRWVCGIDNSDSDKFKIASASDLDTNAYLTIQVGGSVGIGTTSPDYVLDIQITSPANYALTMKSSTGYDGVRFYLDGASGSGNEGAALLLGNPYEATFSSIVKIDSRDGADSYFNSGGNVGIGTTSPNELLDLSSSASGLRISASDDSHNVRATLQTSSGNGGFFELYNAAEVKNVVIRGYGDSYFNAGFVGINQTTPVSLLHIKSDGDPSAIITIERANGTAKIFSFEEDSTGDGLMYIRNSSGTVSHRFDSAAINIMTPVYLYTTTDPTNINVSSSGQIRRVVSSKESKFNIKSNVNPELALLFNPVSYQAKENKKSYFGFVAEELNKIDKRFATNQKEPGEMGIDINCIVAAITATLKKHDIELRALKGLTPFIPEKKTKKAKK